MKKIKVVFFLIFVVKITSACTCIGTENINDAYASSDVVFSGKVISKDIIEVKDSISGLIIKKIRYQVQTEKYFKGVNSEQIVTIISGMGQGDCGYTFELNTKYIIYSNWNNSHFFNGQKVNRFLYTDICKRTKTYNKKEIKKLEKL